MGGWRGGRSRKLSLLVLIISLALIALSFSGCLGNGEGEGGNEEVIASLTIDFMTSEVNSEISIHPGNLTVWEEVNGHWTVDSEANEDRTVWVFKNLSCQPTVLDLMEEAASVGGFELKTSRYTGLGTMVIAIDDVENEVQGRGWQYEVNGEYANLAVNAKGISDGDQVVWKYSQAPW